MGRHFFRLLSSVIVWSYTLLVFYALGKSKLERINEDKRALLIRWINERRERLKCPSLEKLAAEYELDNIYLNLLLSILIDTKSR